MSEKKETPKEQPKQDPPKQEPPKQDPPPRPNRVIIDDGDSRGLNITPDRTTRLS